MILDDERQPVIALPKFNQLQQSEPSVFDAAVFANDDYDALVTAVYANNTPHSYSHLTPQALYLNYADQIRGDDGTLLGVQLLTLRLPTPTTLFLLALGMVVVGMGIFTLAAAAIGTLFGWRTARGLWWRLNDPENFSFTRR